MVFTVVKNSLKGSSINHGEGGSQVWSITAYNRKQPTKRRGPKISEKRPTCFKTLTKQTFQSGGCFLKGPRVVSVRTTELIFLAISRVGN